MLESVAAAVIVGMLAEMRVKISRMEKVCAKRADDCSRQKRIVVHPLVVGAASGMLYFLATLTII